MEKIADSSRRIEDNALSESNRCDTCGTSNPKGSEFCQNCGSRIISYTNALNNKNSLKNELSTKDELKNVLWISEKDTRCGFLIERPKNPKKLKKLKKNQKLILTNTEININGDIHYIDDIENFNIFNKLYGLFLVNIIEIKFRTRPDSFYVSIAGNSAMSIKNEPIRDLFNQLVYVTGNTNKLSELEPYKGYGEGKMAITMLLIIFGILPAYAFAYYQLGRTEPSANKKFYILLIIWLILLPIAVFMRFG